MKKEKVKDESTGCGCRDRDCGGAGASDCGCKGCSDEQKPADDPDAVGVSTEGDPDVASGQAKAEQESESERYMRLMADFQNYKRRSEKERSDIYLFANEKIISELLTVADNFERALGSADAEDGFVKGMQMIFDQLRDIMTKAGAEEIKALGEDFDPNFHNAVMMEESDQYASGKVSDVLQKGYTLNGKVIRPSMVKVAN